MFSVVTDHPVAIDSPDHTHPLGCVNDNSRCRAFVRKVDRLLGHSRVLDLGCAGGGMVRDFRDSFHQAVGIDGSDLPRARGLGEWPRLDDVSLFTADLRHPFAVLNDNGPWFADLVTAWEVFEHIEEPAIAAVMANVRRHLCDRSIIVASIATFDDAPRHQTVRPEEWWLDRFGALGFVNDEALVSYFAPDWVRDQGERGFHVVLRARK